MDNFSHIDIGKELAELGRPGSRLRKDEKWGPVMIEGGIEAEKPYTFREKEGVLYGFIPSENPGLLLGYPLRSIFQRTQIKRAPSVFFGIYSIWKILNPFSRKALTKAAYWNLLLTLYLDIVHAAEEHVDATELIAFDVEADYQSKTALTFAEFYARLFTCIDSCTHSKLISEYVRLVYKLAETVNNSQWLQTLDLHAHNDPGEARKSYEPWMRPFLQENPQTVSLTRLKDSVTAEKSETRKHRPTASSYRKELPLLRTSLRHVDVLLRSQPRKRRERKVVETRPLLSNRKDNLMFKHLEHLEYISPLSKLPRAQTQSSSLLEEVVYVRATHSTRLYPGTQTTLS